MFEHDEFSSSLAQYNLFIGRIFYLPLFLLLCRRLCLRGQSCLKEWSFPGMNYVQLLFCMRMIPQVRDHAKRLSHANLSITDFGCSTQLHVCACMTSTSRLLSFPIEAAGHQSRFIYQHTLHVAIEFERGN